MFTLIFMFTERNIFSRYRAATEGTRGTSLAAFADSDLRSQSIATFLRTCLIWSATLDGEFTLAYGARLGDIFAIITVLAIGLGRKFATAMLAYLERFPCAWPRHNIPLCETICERQGEHRSQVRLVDRGSTYPSSHNNVAQIVDLHKQE